MCPALRWAWIVVVMVAACGWGCFSYSPAHRGRGEGRDLARAELALPPRDVAPLELLRQSTPDRLYRWRPVASDNAAGGLSAEGRAMIEEPLYTITLNEIIDGTLVRMFEYTPGVFSLTWAIAGFKPNGRVVSPRHLDPGQLAIARAAAERSRRARDRIYRQHGVESDPRCDEVGMELGTPFLMPTVVPPRCRGVVLHVWSMLNNNYEHEVVDVVRRAGWFVIDLKPEAIAPARLSPHEAERLAAIQAEHAALEEELPRRMAGESHGRYQRRIAGTRAHQRRRDLEREANAILYPELGVCTRDEIEATGRQLAARIDEVLSDHARAARAVVEVARRAHPAVEGLPLVVMGFSAGALSAPTIAAAAGADAVVLVGGGSNAVGLALESDLADGGVRVSCRGKPPTRPIIEALSEAYLRHSTFDAYHTAPLLQDVPVRVVDAGMDRWVPSRFGEQLYQRLGRPDRLHMGLGGHAMLFYFLPGRASWIERWMSRVTVRDTR